MTHEHDDVREPLDPELADRLRGLPRAVEPERDLWPGIAARLERPAAAPEPVRWWRRGRARSADGGPGGGAHGRLPSGGWRFGQLAAAAVLLAVLAGTGFGLLRVIGPAGPEGTGGPATAAGGPANGAAATEPVPAEATTGAAADVAAVPGADTFGNRLMAALERKRNQLGPATSDAVEADIARLGLAMAEILTAIAEHPDDPALYHHLAARQRQEADLLLRLDQL